MNRIRERESEKESFWTKSSCILSVAGNIFLQVKIIIALARFQFPGKVTNSERERKGG